MTPSNGQLRTSDSGPTAFTAAAPDGFPVNGYVWRNPASRAGRPVVIVGTATSVSCRYYFGFADFLLRNGFDVLTFDYRGIGRSRPPKLRGFDASWLDWGQLDYEAIFQYADQSFPGQPVDVVAHSIGGFIFGLAKSSTKVRRALTVGAQYAFAPDYAAAARFRMIAKWHLLMPLLTLPFGFFPGKRLGWLEDTPKGIVYNWAFGRERFEKGRRSSRYIGKNEIVDQLASLTAPILAISVSDDEFGTIPAIERGLSYYRNARRTHLRISPASIGREEIGHFGFFHRTFAQELWQIPLAWLRNGMLPAVFPGEIVGSR